MTEEKIETPRPPRDPKPLTAEYHKAHKQLMLWGSILLVWELVGVDLEKAKQAGGNVGAIVQSLKSPQAIPVVLLSLVLYFVWKGTVEWHQCDPARRKLLMAQADYTVGLVLAATGFLFFWIQLIIRAQVADRINRAHGFALLWALGASTYLQAWMAREEFLSNAPAAIRRLNPRAKRWLCHMFLLTGLCTVVLWIRNFARSPNSWKGMIILSIIGLLAGYVVVRLVNLDLGEVPQRTTTEPPETPA